MMKKILFALILALGLNTQTYAVQPPPTVFKFIIDRLIESINLQGSEIIKQISNGVLKLRVHKTFEIFDKKGKLVMEGEGKEINITKLPKGKYTIKFDKDANQVEYFTKDS